MTSDDKEPLRSGSDVIPFQYFIEVPEIDQESVWQLASEVDQLSSVMMGNDTIEVRAALNLELLVLQPVRCPVITGIQEKPLDLEALKALPGNYRIYYEERRPVMGCGKTIPHYGRPCHGDE